MLTCTSKSIINIHAQSSRKERFLSWHHMMSSVCNHRLSCLAKYFQTLQLIAIVNLLTCSELWESVYKQRPCAHLDEISSHEYRVVDIGSINPESTQHAGWCDLDQHIRARRSVQLDCSIYRISGCGSKHGC